MQIEFVCYHSGYDQDGNKPEVMCVFQQLTS